MYLIMTEFVKKSGDQFVKIVINKEFEQIETLQ